MRKRNYNQIFRIDARGKFFEVSDSAFGIDRVKFLFRELDQNHKEKATIEYYVDMPDFFELADLINNPRLPLVVKKYVEGGKTYTPIWEVQGGATSLRLKKRGISRPDGKAAAWKFKLLPSTRPNSVMLQVETGVGVENENGGVVFQGKAEKFISIPVGIRQLKAHFEYTRLYINGYYNAYTAVKYQDEAVNRVEKEKDKFWLPEEKIDEGR